MRIAMAASEVAPFAKTGGLGDVTASLARYLAAAGHDVRLFLPFYGNLRERNRSFSAVTFVRDVPIRFGAREYDFSLVTTTLPGTELPVYFVVCPELYARAATYTADADEHLRFAMLSRAAIESCQRMGFAPDVFHVHDWHTALVPLYLKTLYAWDRLFASTRTVLTIHNIAYQGTVSADARHELGFTDVANLLHQDDLARGRLSFLTTGLLWADALTTVSRTHAKEMMTPEHGFGLDPILRARADSFVGIVNGIDTAVWSPEIDPHIAVRYSAEDLDGKAECRRALCREMGLDFAPRAPILGVVSRLTAQKGFELAFNVLPRALEFTPLRLAVLGSGDAGLEAFFHGLERRFPGRAAFRQGYNDALAHRIEAGSDFFLMPSLFEPCGLNQMYSQRYGTVPVVRRTGGLADTVRMFDPSTGRGTGFVFDHYTSQGLEWALVQALHTWNDPISFAQVQLNGMAEDFSWESRVREYVSLYARTRRG